MRNAIIAALVAALVSSGATLAATRISGSAIRPHSIPTNRLTRAAMNTLTAGPAITSTVSAAAVTGLQTVTASCPAGEVVTGGGYLNTTPDQPFQLEGDGPTADGTGWRIVVQPQNSGPGINDSPSFTVNATCVAGGAA